jgi:acyl carrier protein
MKEKLLSLLEDVRPDVDFKSETKLIDDGILDSFDIISIVQSVGESFGVEIDVEDLEPENFNSADAILDLIEKLKK